MPRRRTIPDDALYAWLKECAAKGERMPSNADINGRFIGNSHDAGSAGSALERLAKKGLIRYLKRGARRAVYIVETQQVTAADLHRQVPLSLTSDDPADRVRYILDRFRAGYSTGMLGRILHRSPAEVLAVIAANWALLTARPEAPPEAPSLPPARNTPWSGKLVDTAMHHPLLGPIGPAPTCRFIEASDYRERALKLDQSIYCGARTVAGTSYCEAHRQRCHVAPKPRAIIAPGEVDYSVRSHRARAASS